MKIYEREVELRKFLATRFKRDLSELSLDASLSDELGLDSLDGLELIAEIEDRFDLYFTPDHIAQPRTLRNILEAVSASAWRQAS